MTEANDLPATEEQVDENEFAIEAASSGEVDTKEISTVDEDDNPLEQYTDESGASKREIHDEAIHDYLADQIYDSDSAVIREYLQNAETACVRAARLLISGHDDYGTKWLGRSLWVNEDGETVQDDEKQKVLAEYDDVENSPVRRIEYPRTIERTIEEARNIGYSPVVEIHLHRDERKLIIRDNGIGMTAEEVEKAFNTTGLSGVRNDGSTGGMMGMGALTFKNVTGKKGGMNVITNSRRPDADDGALHFYAYLGGYNPLPTGDIPENVKGTRFEMPIQESFNIRKVQGWVNEYTSGLRVPVLYKEHEGGQVVEKEEYGNHDFIEMFDNPSVTVERPGEFTAVAGPGVGSSSRTTNTWLVSMPIDGQNLYKVNTLWDVKVQLHNEQGLIVAGPNRGSKAEDVDTLHDDDVPLPQPTADRDRLQTGEHLKRFKRYLQKQMKSAEVAEVAEVAYRFKDANHPADVVSEDKDAWDMFKGMVKYHGPSKPAKYESQFKQFLHDRDEFPDFTDEETEQLRTLFKTVSHAHERSYRPSKKKKRRTAVIGDLLGKCDRERVFMAASTSGNFESRYKVVYNTYDNAAVIVVDSASEYPFYQKNFGFRKLKNVPVTKGEHDFDVPEKVHETNLRKKTKTEKADSVEEKTLKIRCDSGSNAIDKRYSIKKIRSRLNDNRTIGNKKNLILFGRGKGPNISDNYDVQKHAAIASASKEEQEALLDLSNVYTYEQFVARATTQRIATTEGVMTPGEILYGDEPVLITYCKSGSYGNWDHTFIYDEGNTPEIRQMVVENVINSRRWVGSKEPDPDEVVVAVVDTRLSDYFSFAVDYLWDYTKDHRVIGLKDDRSYPRSTPIEWGSVRGSTLKRIRTKAEMDNWDNSSEVFDQYIGSTGDYNAFLEGLHELGIDPTKYDSETLKEMVANSGMSPDDAADDGGD